MLNSILLFLIAVLIAISSIISSTSGSMIHRGRRGWKYFTTKGKWVIVLNAFTIVLTLFQNQVNNWQKANDDAVNKKEQDRRDSVLRIQYDSSLLVMKDKFDTSNIKTVSVVSETLGKYGFKLDSSERKLAKLIGDTTRIKIDASESPTLSLKFPGGIVLGELKDHSYKYTFTLCSNDATSTDIDMSFAVITANSVLDSKYNFILKDHSFIGDRMIPKDICNISEFLLPENVPHSYIWICCQASYKNQDKSKSFNLIEVYGLLTATGALSVYNGFVRDRVLKLYNEN